MPIDIARGRAWEPPAEWRRVSVIDAHAAGEPLRVVLDGVDPIPGDTIVAKRAWAGEHLDGLRRGLMFEPRGHADMYGAIVTAAVTADADLGVLFMHNEGWSTMCGHGIIALTTVAVEERSGDRTGEQPRRDVEERGGARDGGRTEAL